LRNFMANVWSILHLPSTHANITGLARLS